ncbi:MAG: type II secretion system protein [Firmicutes bacterium]|nr:type II secretion system protein [Bacillota bacterium]
MGIRRKKIVAGEKGFTLVELLIVLGIIAVLATVAMLSFGGRVDEARQSVEKVNITVIQGAVDLYYHDQKKYPETLEDLYDANQNGGPYIRTPLEDLQEGGVEYVINQLTGKVTVKPVESG